jgi:hypothetical protein
LVRIVSTSFALRVEANVVAV